MEFMGSGDKVGLRYFSSDFTKSQSARDILFWENHYKLRFPDMQYPPKKANEEEDKKGIDYFVYRLDQEPYPIQNKIRYKNYRDILLEKFHILDDGTSIPGWISQLDEVAEIAYGIYPTNKVFWIETTSLKNAWLENNKNWNDQYGPDKSSRTMTSNRNWRTFNLPVPVKALINAGVKIIITRIIITKLNRE